MSSNKKTTPNCASAKLIHLTDHGGVCVHLKLNSQLALKRANVMQMLLQVFVVYFLCVNAGREY